MTDPKFNKGDRLRVVEDVVTGAGKVCLKKGDIHTATGTAPGWVSLTPNSGAAEWIEDRFELYAKAGEFVAGDYVVPLDGDDVVTLNILEAGRVYEVEAVYGADPVSYLIVNGGSHYQSRFRLATAEEIAAADVQAARWSVKVEAATAVTGEAFTLFPRPAEIPAAEFDFSTIKEGDRLVVRLTVMSDGLDRDGEINVNSDKIAGWVKPEHIISVIAAPRPKTLRERAIEAARSVVDDRDYLDDIVDAVLAEIEKSR